MAFKFFLMLAEKLFNITEEEASTTPAWRHHAEANSEEESQLILAVAVILRGHSILPILGISMPFVLYEKLIFLSVHLIYLIYICLF